MNLNGQSMYQNVVPHCFAFPPTLSIYTPSQLQLTIIFHSIILIYWHSVTWSVSLGSILIISHYGPVLSCCILLEDLLILLLASLSISPSIPNPSSTSQATLFGFICAHLPSLTHAFLFAIGFLKVRTFFLLVWEMPGCNPFLSYSAEVSQQGMGRLTAREAIIVRGVSLWCETGR